MADPSIILRDDSVKSKFWKRVERRGPDECWPWTGATSRGGRGVLSCRGSNVVAPRLSLVLASGSPPQQGMFACHSCDNPNCVNPAHLWWGTNQDNIRDAASKGRLPHAVKTHCKNGHPLEGDNLRICKRGYRACRACQIIYRRKSGRKMRAIRKGLNYEQ